MVYYGVSAFLLVLPLDRTFRQESFLGYGD